MARERVRQSARDATVRTASRRRTPPSARTEPPDHENGPFEHAQQTVGNQVVQRFVVQREWLDRPGNWVTKSQGYSGVHGLLQLMQYWESAGTTSDKLAALTLLKSNIAVVRGNIPAAKLGKFAQDTVSARLAALEGEVDTETRKLSAQTGKPQTTTSTSTPTTPKTPVVDTPKPSVVTSTPSGAVPLKPVPQVKNGTSVGSSTKLTKPVVDSTTVSKPEVSAATVSSPTPGPIGVKKTWGRPPTLPGSMPSTVTATKPEVTTVSGGTTASGARPRWRRPDPTPSVETPSKPAPSKPAPSKPAVSEQAPSKPAPPIIESTTVDLPPPVPKTTTPGPNGKTVATPKLPAQEKPVIGEPAHSIPPAPWASDPASYLRSEFDASEVVPSGTSDTNAKAWTKPELSVVAKIFNALGKDKSAVRGVNLERVGTLDEGKKPTDDTASTWNTLALFSHTLGIKGGAGNKFVVSDKAFGAMSGSVGSTAAAEETFAHEAGHAVESESSRSRSWDVTTAQDAYNTKVEANNAALPLMNDAIDAHNQAIRDYSTAIDVYNAKARLKDTAYRTYSTRHAEWQAEINTYNRTTQPAAKQASERRRTEKEQATVEAKARYQLALDAMQAAEIPMKQAKQKQDELEVIKDLRVKQHKDGPEAAMKAAGKVRDDKNVLLAQVYNKTKKRTHRILNFVNLVNSKGIKPDLTAYAKREWPAKPGEFYAEAFAFFITDKSVLEKHSADLSQYFNDGKHRDDTPPS